MADEPRRIRKPTVLGYPVPPREDDEVPRNVRRSHPGAESTNPPPAPRAPRPPFEPKHTPLDLPVIRLPGSEAPPPPSSDALHIRIPKGLLIAVVATAITTGANVLATILRKPAASPELVVQQRKIVDDNSAKRHERVIGLLEDQATINQIWIDLACEINGGVPPARGVKCRLNACEQQPQADGKTPGPICVSKTPWPDPR